VLVKMVIVDFMEELLLDMENTEDMLIKKQEMEFHVQMECLEIHIMV